MHETGGTAVLRQPDPAPSDRVGRDRTGPDGWRLTRPVAEIELPDTGPGRDRPRRVLGLGDAAAGAAADRGRHRPRVRRRRPGSRRGAQRGRGARPAGGAVRRARLVAEVSARACRSPTQPRSRRCSRSSASRARPASTCASPTRSRRSSGPAATRARPTWRSTGSPPRRSRLSAGRRRAGGTLGARAACAPGGGPLVRSRARAARAPRPRRPRPLLRSAHLPGRRRAPGRDGGLPATLLEAAASRRSPATPGCWCGPC